ncbi:DUF3159 domain-containing protein [Kitasatospora sp. McL0602]|uniref:DUF3159 domain-containing protein n=1 Tax=Kitasatospora sp. McL0602 TaxID=3439530 RepID=UPI003F8893E0
MTNLPGGDPAARTAVPGDDRYLEASVEQALTAVTAAGPGEATAEETAEEIAAREAAASREAADSIMKAFGGIRGMVDMTLPGLVFILTFNITHQVSTAAWAALGLSAVFVVIRLLRRETIQHAFSGVFGVAIGAWISMKTGKAENFYLPGLLYNVAYCLALAISAVVRWPLVGLMLGPVTGEMFTWRTENPGRLKAYTKATWAWVVIMGIKPVILFPLYFTGDTTLLGWLKTALGIPALVLAMYVTWRILLKAPPPIKAPVED